MTQEHIIFALAGLSLVLFIWNIVTEVRLHKLLRGKDARTLEDTIGILGKESDEFKRFRKTLEEYLKGAETRIRKSVQGVGTIRFNPFQGTGAGGNQSFATAFLNEEGDGVVLSSLYSRERVSIFSKPILKYTSEYGLTDEEKEAIKKADTRK